MFMRGVAGVKYNINLLYRLYLYGVAGATMCVMCMYGAASVTWYIFSICILHTLFGLTYMIVDV